MCTYVYTYKLYIYNPKHSHLQRIIACWRHHDGFFWQALHAADSLPMSPQHLTSQWLTLQIPEGHVASCTSCHHGWCSVCPHHQQTEQSYTHWCRLCHIVMQIVSQSLILVFLKSTCIIGLFSVETTDDLRTVQWADKRKMLNLKLQHKVSCSEIRKITKIIDIIDNTLKQIWAEHTARMKDNTWTKCCT